VAALLCATLPGTATLPQAGPAQVRLTLLATTDLHGNLIPVDYLTDQPANRGLAKIATLVRQVRREEKNVLLFDCGDTIQGTPLAYYFARIDASRPDPTIAAMNAIGYDAMAVGNHEFNFGLRPLWKAKTEARFPWLAANIRSGYRENSANFLPYVIREVAGVKVGIIGLVTPRVPNWELPENYTGYEFEEIVAAARRVVPEVRAQADLLVVIAHSGLGRDFTTGAPLADELPGENAILDLAEQVPGIDIILFGHTHGEMPGTMFNGVLLAQARNWGQSLARADIEMTRDSEGRWSVSAKSAKTIPANDSVEPDARILALAAPYHQQTQAYLNTRLANSGAALDGFTGRVEDHPLVDLIHQVQLEAGAADVSLATMFITGLRFAEGPVTLRQIYALYLYENSLYTLEMTGAQLREALEHAAAHFPAWPAPAGERLRLPNYNADSAEGVDYQVDLTRPVGQRIRNLSFQGEPLAADRKLRVAVNNYRYWGGGGYEVYRGLPVLYRAPVEVREQIIERVRRTGAVLTRASGNWEVVPAEARQALVEAARPRPRAAAAPARRLPSGNLSIAQFRY